MPGSIPAGNLADIPELLAERLFPDVEPEDLTLERSRSLVLARLLEDGDSNDIAWLFTVLPEDEISAWLTARGERKLSRRSAAFWQAVLGVSAGFPALGRPDLWPL